MKKTIFLMALSLPLLSWPPPSFSGEKVCLTKADLGRIDFNFQIRSSRQGCRPNEREYEIKREADGTLIFLPPDSSQTAPASQPAPPSRKP